MKASAGTAIALILVCGGASRADDAALGREGLPGVAHTYSALTLQSGKLGVGLYSLGTMDEQLFRNGAISRDYATGKVDEFILANTNAMLSLGIGDYLDIAAALPFYYEKINVNAFGGELVNAQEVGDMRYRLKLQIPRAEKDHVWDLAVVAGGTIPTQKDKGIVPREIEYHFGDFLTTPRGAGPFGTYTPSAMGALAFTLNLANAGLRESPVFWHWNAGARKPDALDQENFENVLFYGSALEWRPIPYVGLFGEFYHESRFNRVGDSREWKTEPTLVTLGAMLRAPMGFDLQAGVQLSPVTGWDSVEYVNQTTGGHQYDFAVRAAPQAAAFAQITWAGFIVSQDDDHDGIPNKLDKCPNEPEDKDGFQDEDGCPDPDNDKDGIPDIRDKCPNDPEDFDGFQDTDGCPDPDNDQDGVCDPWVAEQGQSAKYANLCRGSDKCPNLAGPGTADGCPDPDADKDGLCDPWVAEKGMQATFASVCKGVDKCPNDPEDIDGFQDDDGCPDPDNDKDGICDPWVVEKGLSAKYANLCRGSDKCPNAPETVNGYLDDDGCPDSVLQVKQSLVLRGVNFMTNSAQLTPDSYAVLDDIAAQLKAIPDAELEVQGHTDNVGKPAYNQKLSQRRAEAVAGYLVQKGVAASHVKAVGYGDTHPVASNRAAEGRAMNRRVELKRIK